MKVSQCLLVLSCTLFASGLIADHPKDHVRKIERSFLVRMNCDLNKKEAAPSKSDICIHHPFIIFNHFTEAYGLEPWISDGTTEGTHLLCDINSGKGSSYPVNYHPVPNTSFTVFCANDGIHGQEPWITDGTSANTFMLKDIRSGKKGSFPKSFASTIENAEQIQLLFSANDGIHGTEPWTSLFSLSTGGNKKSGEFVSDTMMVSDIYEGEISSDPLSYCYSDVAGGFFFTASDPEYGSELWKVPKLCTETIMTKDIFPGQNGDYPNSSYPHGFFSWNNKVFFSATTAEEGTELWKTDGTEAGTSLVADINPGAGSSSANPICARIPDGPMLFSANDGTTGTELWQTNGLTVQLLKDFNQSVQGPAPHYLNHKNTFGGENDPYAFFSAYDSSIGSELMYSDGTVSGTALCADLIPGSTSGLSDISSGTWIAPETFIFTASDPSMSGGRIMLVTETLNTWNTPVVAPLPLTTNPMPVVHGPFSEENPLKAVISADAEVTLTPDMRKSDLKGGYALWLSDGTQNGSTQVFDLTTGTADALPMYPFMFQNKVFLTAFTPETGRELYVYDPSTDETILFKDIAEGTLSGFPSNENPNFYVFENKLYFLANDGIHGREMWVSNGTPDGTALFFDFNSEAASGWTTTQLASFASIQTETSHTLYFAARNGTSGMELWKTQGTPETTVMIEDIYPGSIGSFPVQLTTLGESLYFFAANSTNGSELWRSDGTEAGTIMIKDIRAGGNGCNPMFMTRLMGKLFFQATTSESGAEPWISDGTEEGTLQLKDINSTGGSSPQNFTLCNNAIFFCAYTSENGSELWQTDGTEQGTLMVKDLYPGGSSTEGTFTPYSSTPNQFRSIGNTLYFAATTASNMNTVLCRSDGTEAGTFMIQNPDNQQNLARFIRNMTVLNDLLCFRAIATEYGSELFVSDGTMDGTNILEDICPGSQSSSPDHLLALPDRLFFSATEGFMGIEIWTAKLNIPSTSAEDWIRFQ